MNASEYLLATLLLASSSVFIIVHVSSAEEATEDEEVEFGEIVYEEVETGLNEHVTSEGEEVYSEAEGPGITIENGVCRYKNKSYEDDEVILVGACEPWRCNATSNALNGDTCERHENSSYCETSNRYFKGIAYPNCCPQEICF